MEDSAAEVKGPKTITYARFSSQEFSQVVMKIAYTPTTVEKANALRKIVRFIEKEKGNITTQYKTEIMDKYFQKNADGTYVIDETTREYVYLKAGTEKDVEKATTEFNERTLVIEMPFRPHLLTDVKSITAKEMEVLGDFYAEEEGPGLPNFQSSRVAGSNVTQLRQ